jgi:hypothetical protein
MYQPYPTGGQGPVAPPEAPAPQSVLTAVRLMYAGAALNAIEIIIGLTTIGSLRSAILSQYPHYAENKIHAVEVAVIAGSVIFGALAVGLWLWMAWANGRGRSWARIVASVLFGLNTISVLTQVAQPHALISLVFTILVWLAGLGAIYFIWQRDSSAFYQARSQRPR